MNDLLGIDIINIITIMAAVGAALVVVIVWQATVEAKPMGRRLKHLDERKEALKSGIVAPKKRSSPVRSTKNIGAMKDIVDRFKILQSEQTAKAKSLLLQAGYRNQDALVMFTFAKMALPVVMLILAATIVYGMKFLIGNPVGQMFTLLASAVAGFYIPNVMIQNTATKRQTSIQKALPDALDLMVICAEAGLTLDASMTRVSREMALQSVELSEECGLAAVELGFLSDRREALTNLTERVPLKSIRSVVATLIQTEKYGTPLAHSLRVLSQEFRNERMMKAEEKAARLPAVMTVPLILFILPMLFIILLGPAACSIADNVIGRF